MAQATADRLATRLMSAAALIPVLLLAIWAGGYWTAAVAALAALLALRELGTLTRAAGWRPLVYEGAAWGAAVVVVAPGGTRIVLLALAAGAIATLAVAVATRRSAAAVGDWTITAAGAAYVAAPLTALVLLREGEAGAAWLIVAFFGTFATDTGSYVVGKLLGRHKMAPRVSPGKTWEGAAGGLVAGTGATVALVAVLGSIETALGAAALLGLGIAVAGQAGDLAESWLKRLAGAKDSGRLIPGHGGLLDRMDSLLPVFLLVYAASRLWPGA
ncbi:MAG: phosphatidate cytidylyltransferase [Chloroflexi bacterium]|nr:phosphatidate cytidylyltransferase [Chloroflexota bacterium]